MLAHDFFSAEMREGSRERFLGSKRETEIFGILTNSIRLSIAIGLQERVSLIRLRLLLFFLGHDA